MISIGIRVSPQKVFYTIVETIDENFEVLTCDHLVIPKALDFPTQLSFVRTSLFSIMMEYRVKTAGIRITEPISQNLSIKRLYIEGVIQELIANCTVERYFAEEKSGIASILSEPVTAISAYFNAENVFYGIEDWRSHTKEERESIVAAVAASLLEIGVDQI